MNQLQKEQNPGPFLSVIVPTLNSGKVLDACLGSAVTQTYKNIEIIIHVPIMRMEDTAQGNLTGFLKRKGSLSICL